MGEPPEISYSLAFFGSLGLLLLAFFIVIFFLKYQKKMLERHQHYLEQEIKTKELLHLKEKEQQNLLLESIVGAQEKEQRRIAQDLHDEIGPVLAFIKIKAGYLQQCLQENPELEAVSKEVADQLAGAIVQIRRITHDLLPQIVEDLGIVEALKELAANVSTAAGVEFTFDEGKVQEFPLEIRQEVTLYRIVQELVHNSLKHGKPSRIYLTLALTKEELTLIYQDNGLGFSTEEVLSKTRPVRGLGLRNIQGRLDLLKGKLEIQSTPGKGSIFNIIVPLS